MRLRQREGRFLVLGDRVACGLEGVSVVALLTTIAPRRARKLPLVLILVAIHTPCKLDHVTGILACRLMAPLALHLLMRRHQRKLGLGVVRNREGGRLPSRDSVTTLAPAAIYPLKELAAVGIGLVAIRTELVRNRRLEVSASVASHA